VLVRGIRSKNNCYKWVPQQEGENGQQTRMFHTMLKHQEIYKVLEFSPFGSIDDRRSVSRSFPLVNNQICAQHYSIRDLVEEKIMPTKDLFVDKNRKVLNMKQFEKLKDKLVISQNKGLQQLLYDRCATTLFVSLLSLVHDNS